MWRKGKEKRGTITEHEDYVKAAAWAWYLHGVGAQSKHVEESNAQSRKKSPSERRRRPTRFKLEAMGLLNNNCWIENSFATLDTAESNFANGCTNLHDLLSMECEAEICGSSLFDSYELVALSRQLETVFWGVANPAYGKVLSVSTKSWMDHGICPDLCNKKPKGRLPSPPVMCSSAQVVTPEYIGSSRESPGPKKKHHHSRLYEFARKLQVFGVSSAHT